MQNILPKFVMLKRILSSPARNFTTATANTIDDQEIGKFRKLTEEWWSEFGPLKALHSMNKLRVPFIRDGLINTVKIDGDKKDTPKPLTGVSILDIGCGGGILSEPLARLGGDVTGIDASSDLINLAKTHAESKNLNINYITSSIEEHSTNNGEKYDAVVASEIIEHITQKHEFISASVKCLKPSGSIFFTTINKTRAAKWLGIFLAENIFQLLPSGTHEYDKFLEPTKLQRILQDNNCRTELIHGLVYNVFTNSWHWCSDNSINYALHAVKLKSCE